MKKKSLQISHHFIGKINGLKIELNYSKSNLDTDIKSLKKAARSGSQNELKKRINYIIDNLNSLELRNDYKIYWNEKKIAELKPGKNYLNPQIKLHIDDNIEENQFTRLKIAIEDWIESQINLNINNNKFTKNVINTINPFVLRFIDFSAKYLLIKYH